MPDLIDADIPGNGAAKDDPYFAERELVFKPITSLEEYDQLAVPSGAIPQTWRQLLAYAVGWTCLNGELSDAEYLTQFEERRGPCTTMHLVELAELHLSGALLHDEDDTEGEVIFILLMLGVWPEHPYAKLARDVLVRYLNCPDLRERLLSAISLSHLRDERAIPALLALLMDGLPDPNVPFVLTQPDENGRRRFFQQFDQFGHYRQEIPDILARWDVRSAVPALRHALDLTVRIEKAEAQRDPRWRSQGHWRSYQWALVWAMGWLGAYEALKGIEPVEENFLRLGYSIDHLTGTRTPTTKGDPKTYLAQRWRVALCRAAMTRRYEETGRHGTISDREVRPELERLLAEQFGMDADERLAALEAWGIYNLDLRLDVL